MNDLFIGAGKGIGAKLAHDRGHAGHRVFHITSQHSDRKDYFTVDWSSVGEPYLHKYLANLPVIDLLFFNQNSSSLSAASFRSGTYGVIDLWRQLRHWRQSHYVSCLMPFQIIHTLADRLHAESRVCWMLSSMVVKHNHDPAHADYVGNKFQNYMLVKNFAMNHPSCFVGIDPGEVRAFDHDQKSAAIQALIQRPKAQINGRVFDMTGQQSALFDVFS